MEYSPNQRFGGSHSRSPALSTLSTRDMDRVRTPTVGPSNNEFLSPALNPQHPSMARIDAAPAMLTDFVASGRPEPWNALFAFPENGNQSCSVQTAVPAFYNFRNPASVSVASDSGYASLHKRVIDDMSFIGDGSFHPDIQTISAGIGTVTFNAAKAREQEIPPSNPDKTVTTEADAKSELRCPQCNETMKTNSMLRYVKAEASCRLD